MHTEAAEASPSPAAPEPPQRIEDPDRESPEAAEASPSPAEPAEMPERIEDPDRESPEAAEASPGSAEPADTPQRTEDPDGPPLLSRALLALTAAATIAVAPLAAAAIGPAGSGQSAHSVPVYLISRISHDVGHNDWAFQGQDAGRVSWVVTYVALALFWLAASLWIRARMRRSEVPETGRVRLWLRVFLAAWSAELITGLLTLGAGAYAEWTSTPIGAGVLKFADLCSPWWSCVAAVLVVARAERSTLALRAIAGYALLLAIVLLVPLPGPNAIKVLLLALPAAVPALLTPRQQGEEKSGTDPSAPVTPNAAAAG